MRVQFIIIIACLFFHNACSQATNEKQYLYTDVDKIPQFNQDEFSLREYVNKNLEWPHSELTINGVVLLSFVVNHNGDVSNIKVERGLCEICDNNAKKVFQNMPKWKPGKHKGAAVSVIMYYPVSFKIRG